MLVKFQAVVSELLKSHPMWDVGMPYIQYTSYTNKNKKLWNIEFGNIEEKQL